MTPGEWFWGGFYLGFGAIASSLIVVGGFTLVMAVIEHIGDKRSEKALKKQREDEWMESMMASYKRYHREHPEAPDPWAEDCKDGYFEDGE